MVTAVWPSAAFTAAVAEALGFDENRANTLIASDGVLTGDVGGPILLDHVHDMPPQPEQHPRDLHIGDVGGPVAEVLTAVVFGADPELLPHHVNAADVAPALIADHHLRGRWW